MTTVKFNSIKNLIETAFFHSWQRTSMILGGFIITLALPVTIILTQQQQDLRQEASSNNLIDIECTTISKTGTIEQYDSPRCGSGIEGNYDANKANSGFFKDKQYYDVYICKDSNGVSYQSEYAININTCSNSPWTTSSITPNDPAQTADYQLLCPDDGNHKCDVDVNCPNNPGLTHKATGDQACLDNSPNTPRCCSK